MSDSPAPQWADFFSRERLDIFLERVEKYLLGLGHPFRISREGGSFSVTRDGIEETFGLINLAQICNQSPLDDWDSVIGPFIEESLNFQGADEIPIDFEEARPLLRIRMFAPQTLETGALVKLPIADEFITCLAVDLPTKVLSMSRTQAVAYRVGSEELFKIAFQNLREKVAYERSEVAATERASVTILEGGDFFVASLALVLDDIEGPAPALGRFVAVPNRHIVLTAPIADADSLGAMGLMVHAARGMFRDGPGSITPYVFWVRGSHWTRLDIELTEEGIGVQGPDSFIETVLEPLLGQG